MLFRSDLSRTDWANHNRYAYAAGDPVNRIDPTGRLSTFQLVELNVALGLLGGLIAFVGVTNFVQYAFGHEVSWKGKLFTGGISASALIGFSSELLRVETREPVRVPGKPKAYVNALYSIFEINIGLSFKLPFGVSNSDVRLTSPGIFGANGTTMQGLFLRSGSGAAVGSRGAGLGFIRAGWFAVGTYYSNPLGASTGPIPGIPVNSEVQLAVGIDFGIGLSFPLTDPNEIYRSSPQLG